MTRVMTENETLNSETAQLRSNLESIEEKTKQLEKEFQKVQDRYN